MNFLPKYNMAVEDNIFVAKRNIVDYIWKSVNLEGFSLTYPDTDTVFNNIGIDGVSVTAIVTVNNLKRAWQFVLDTLDYPTDFKLVCEINQEVGGGLFNNAGYVRNLPVRMGGTDWAPAPYPNEAAIIEDLNALLALDDVMDRALSCALYLMRTQAFLDGNKRTAMLVANHILISHGAGVLSIPISFQREFKTLLLKYYETGEADTLKQFLYDNCIDGMNF